MTPSNAPASKKQDIRPSFDELVNLRREWRNFHEKQDRENAELVFRKAGVDLITELDLSFFPQIFHQKLNEFGRDWERVLAVQALREGFSFYRLQISISVDHVNELHRWIENRFEGYGASLFFESNGLHALNNGIWDAIFYFTLKPGFTPESLSFETGPGVQSVEKTLRIV